MTDRDVPAGVSRSTPKSSRGVAWALTAAMVLIALAGFITTGGWHGLIWLAVLAALFVARMWVVEKWRR